MWFAIIISSWVGITHTDTGLSAVLILGYPEIGGLKEPRGHCIRAS